MAFLIINVKLCLFTINLNFGEMFATIGPSNALVFCLIISDTAILIFLFNYSVFLTKKIRCTFRAFFLFVWRYQSGSPVDRCIEILNSFWAPVSEFMLDTPNTTMPIDSSHIFHPAFLPISHRKKKWFF